MTIIYDGWRVEVYIAFTLIKYLIDRDYGNELGNI